MRSREPYVWNLLLLSVQGGLKNGHGRTTSPTVLANVTETSSVTWLKLILPRDAILL